MVRKLGLPSRPLPIAKRVWRWNPPQPAARWRWCRVYHQNKYTTDGITFRRYGPTARIDHPTTPLAMFNLAAKGAGMAIGALPALSDGNEARSLTQQWARAIYEDQRQWTRNHRHSLPIRLQQRPGASTTGLRRRRRNRARRRRPSTRHRARRPRILPRLQVQLRRRQISITTVTSSECNECKKEPLGP